MANLIFLLISLPLLFTTLTFIPFTANAISSCNEPCQTLDDCDGPLICIFGRCKGDPFIEFHMCHKHHLPHHRGGGDHCKSSGTVTCNGNEYHTYKCSPKVTYSTRAKLTHNDFSKYEDGGGDGWQSWKCDEGYNRDERYHRESERVVALSTGWYNGGSRCGKNIRITARNGRSTTAKVVDECDSRRGCDEKHGYRPPCKNNVVDGSDAVWRALGLNKNVGVVDITWSMT